MTSRRHAVQHTEDGDEEFEKEVVRLNKKVDELTTSLKNAEHLIEQWKETAEVRSEMLKEKYAEMEKLKKRIAQMKGSKKIHEEILALKAKRENFQKKIEKEILALKAEQVCARIEADKELEERERELEMAEDVNEEGY
ncbi:hypothetical protein KCU77_g7705, partial [Aureobasidium melanogenum]